jgi:hypothetical protein
MDFDTDLKLAIYRHVVDATTVPTVADMARATGRGVAEVRAGYRRLFDKRVLVLEPDGETIRMAPPFSGVETQHRVRADGREYFANCAWDALGILAALHRPGEVLSRCEQSREPLRLTVSEEGPAPEPCIIHFAVPAAFWWKDIVYT